MKVLSVQVSFFSVAEMRGGGIWIYGGGMLAEKMECPSYFLFILSHVENMVI
jgi:hypothetical protein